jgi:hypothetical protein
LQDNFTLEVKLATNWKEFEDENSVCGLLQNDTNLSFLSGQHENSFMNNSKLICAVFNGMSFQRNKMHIFDKLIKNPESVVINFYNTTVYINECKFQKKYGSCGEKVLGYQHSLECWTELIMHSEYADFKVVYNTIINNFLYENCLTEMDRNNIKKKHDGLGFIIEKIDLQHVGLGKFKKPRHC